MLVSFIYALLELLNSKNVNYGIIIPPHLITHRTTFSRRFYARELFQVLFLIRFYEIFKPIKSFFVTVDCFFFISLHTAV